MRAARIDANQQEIVTALRAVGASVQSMARLGKGAPDLLVGYQGQNWIMEVKAAKGMLRALQGVWLSNWRGRVAVVRTPDEALALLGVTVRLDPRARRQQARLTAEPTDWTR